jgi:hypothetical protein
MAVAGNDGTKINAVRAMRADLVVACDVYKKQLQYEENERKRDS